mmetsp:Transcript_29541/g.96208  ORF Transcript_29541/g.96208 Transcript_29541/m.96208 type:complete len:448 (-) Transcript_29541:1773-3116(-)
MRCAVVVRYNSAVVVRCGGVDHGLSTRGRRAAQPANSYRAEFKRLKQDEWSPENPSGAIIVCVAENMLSRELVQRKLSPALASCSLDDLPYGDYSGIECLRGAIAAFLGERDGYVRGLCANDVCVTAGAGAALESTVHAITEPNDAVLIPAPFYPSFTNDLEVRCAARPVAVHPAGPDAEAIVAALEAAAASEAESGKVLLFSNPCNPTGQVVAAEVVRAMLRWAFARGFHVISDEIYALSCFEEEGRGAERFRSALSVAAGEEEMTEAAKTHLHILGGFSKDFCASGLRVGWVVSRNQELRAANANLGYFHAVPNNLQRAVAELLSDEEWVTEYIAENCNRLRRQHKVLADVLTSAGIPFQPANSALFCMIDLRSWLSSPTPEAERELWRDLVEEARVLVTPGLECFAPEPGFFRLCFAAAAPEALQEMGSRLARVLKARATLLET